MRGARVDEEETRFVCCAAGETVVKEEKINGRVCVCVWILRTKICEMSQILRCV